MYNPTVGRWMEEDPIDFQAGDADKYRYTSNNPTDKIDPTGLAGKSLWELLQDLDRKWAANPRPFLVGLIDTTKTGSHGWTKVQKRETINSVATTLDVKGGTILFGKYVGWNLEAGDGLIALSGLGQGVYDVTVRVSLSAAAHKGRLIGHIFLFDSTGKNIAGAFLRKEPITQTRTIKVAVRYGGYLLRQSVHVFADKGEGEVTTTVKVELLKIVDAKGKVIPLQKE
jgi:hypothetical protein